MTSAPSPVEPGKSEKLAGHKRQNPAPETPSVCRTVHRSHSHTSLTSCHVHFQAVACGSRERAAAGRTRVLTKGLGARGPRGRKRGTVTAPGTRGGSGPRGPRDRPRRPQPHGQQLPRPGMARVGSWPHRGRWARSGQQRPNPASWERTLGGGLSGKPDAPAHAGFLVT